MSQSGTYKNQKSVAIAGAGIIGMSIAWRLAQQGFSVAVFDKGSIGGEASWAGAGMLAPGGEFDSLSELAKLAIASRRLYREFVRGLEEAAQLAIDYQECGALDLAYDTAHWKALLRRAEQQASFGVPSKALSATQVTTFWPRVHAPDLVGALFYPEDSIVNPRELMLALSAACRHLGVELAENSSVVSAEIAPEGVTLNTEGRTRQFDALVIAAGAWSSTIHIESSQINNVPPLPLSRPVKGHLIGFQQPAQTCNTIVRHGHTYLLQRANGLLIAGASVEDAGWDRGIDLKIVASLAKEAAFVLPHLTETGPSETWIGFRPASDTLYIGSWHSSRLYLAYGHYRNGILLAPITAQMIESEINASLQTL